MREIKFRALDDSISKYIEWEELLKNDKDGRSHYGISRIFTRENYHYHLEQFTGLYDKKGKEIYEGDIIDCDMTWVDTVLPHRGSIVYCDNFCSFATENYSGKTLLSKLRVWTIEVMGNIHENANLLENK